MKRLVPTTFILLLSAVSSIDDPLGIFCGSEDCYEVLGVMRANVDAKSIKKAYRQMSLKYHPDKNKDEDATAKFRLVAKAAEVLGDDEQRELYDYYLDHPSQYYKVSGVHFYKSIPKTDVRYIVAGLVVLLSVLLPVLQYQRHEDAVRMVHCGLPVNGGGTVASMRLHHLCLDRYREMSAVEEACPPSLKVTSKVSVPKKPSQIIKDPAFLKIVRETLSELNLEGSFKKPGLTDILIIQIIMLPYTFFVWLRNVSVTACMNSIGSAVAGAVSCVGDLLSRAAAKVESTDQVAPQVSKLKKNPVVHGYSSVVDELVASSDSEIDATGPVASPLSEHEIARSSLQKVLLARAIGNSKKKSLRSIPFSKPEVKFVCSRLTTDLVQSFLSLATGSAEGDSGEFSEVFSCN